MSIRMRVLLAMLLGAISAQAGGPWIDLTRVASASAPGPVHQAASSPPADASEGPMPPRLPRQMPGQGLDGD